MRARLGYANVTATLALFVVLGGVGIASIPGPDGRIHACYADSRGSMRIVDSEASCETGESRITFNQTGPQGPAGAAGPAGQRGPSGRALSKDTLTSLRRADQLQTATLAVVAAAIEVLTNLEEQASAQKEAAKTKQVHAKLLGRLRKQERKLKKQVIKLKKLVPCRRC